MTILDGVRCHFCQTARPDLHQSPIDPAMWWCPPGDVGCNFRARRRLGIPAHVNFAAKARDLELLAADARDTADWVAAQPPRARDEVCLAYIRSAEWERFANEQKILARHRCEKCDQVGFDVEAHHRNYDRFGHEQPEDVLVLCPRCHRDLDDLRRAGRHPVFTVDITGTPPRRIVTWIDNQPDMYAADGAARGGTT